MTLRVIHLGKTFLAQVSWFLQRPKSLWEALQGLTRSRGSA